MSEHLPPPTPWPLAWFEQSLNSACLLPTSHQGLRAKCRFWGPLVDNQKLPSLVTTRASACTITPLPLNANQWRTCGLFLKSNLPERMNINILYLSHYKKLMFSGRMWILEDDNKFLHHSVRTVAKSSSCMGMSYIGYVPVRSTLNIQIVSCSCLFLHH